MTTSRERRAAPHLGILGALFALLAPAAAGPALADSIYLRSGAIVRTDSARIDNGRVVFEQYGAWVVIPLAIVARVVEDDFTGPRPTERAATQTRGGVSAAASPAGAATPRTADLTSERSAEERAQGTRQNRERTIREKREELESMRAFLEKAETAFLFSHRSTRDVKQRIGEVDDRLARLDREARDPDRAKRDRGDKREALEVDRAFLKRAEAAFLHSHRSTAEVKQRIREVDKRLRRRSGG